MMQRDLKMASSASIDSASDERSDINLTCDDIQKEIDNQEGLDTIENTPIKRAKEMYQNWIQKAKLKQNSSNRSIAMNENGIPSNVLSSQLIPSNLQKGESSSDNDCTRIQIDLCDNQNQNSLIVIFRYDTKFSFWYNMIDLFFRKIEYFAKIETHILFIHFDDK